MIINNNRLQQKMDEAGLDGLIATTLGNVRYLTGVFGDGLRLFPYDHQTYAVINRDHPDQAYFVEGQGLVNQILDGYPTIAGTVTYGRFYRPGPFLDVTLSEDEQRLMAMSVEARPEATSVDALVVAIRKLGLTGKKIGIDEVNLKAGVLESLQAKLPDCAFAPASALFRQVRKVKTADELVLLRKVTRIVENAISATLSVVREGITEIDLTREFDRSIVSQGGRPAFSLIHFNGNAVAGETLPKPTQLHYGDNIWFDVGCECNGYWADLARTACYGEPRPRVRSVYHAVLVGEQAAIDQTCAGMTGEQVFNLTMEASRNAGLPHYERHHVGHGIGAELYEDVMIAPGVKNIIEEGTVVNIETPYYEFGLGGIHVEDPFIVRAGGNEIITKLSRELLVVD